MEGLIALVVIVIIVYGVVKNSARRTEKPRPGDPYVCSGCGTQMRHSKRTISAWTNGAKKLYCTKCHSRWWKEQAKKKPAGCLGLIVVIVTLPLMITIAATFLS